MSKKRLLPKYVTEFKDVRGKWRLQFRRKGFARYYFQHKFGTEEFRTEYRRCLDGEDLRVQPGQDRITSGTIADLVSRYVSVPSRLGPSAGTQTKIRRIMDKFREEYGKAYVRDVQFDHIDEIVEKKLTVRRVGKRMEGGPEAAKKLRKELVRLFDFGIKIKMISENPVAQSERVKAKAGTFHTWTESEITQYRKHHAIGTKARLAMELMLWSGQRRIDAIKLGMHSIQRGRFEFTQTKGNKEMGIPVAPQLLDAITAMPPSPEGMPFLLTEWGKPFTNAGFGNKMRDWCDQADLPQCSAHGLRKAMMRRLAELEMGNQQLKSVSGHSKDDEVALYTAAASQRALADSAIAKLAAWEKSNVVSNVEV